jgi:hypothetical protein
MAEIPAAMRKDDRHEDPHFTPGEYLYRRVPLESWEEGEEVDVDAIELPDMSVLRSKYGHPEWARLESDDYAEWGVIGFMVGDIPPELLHSGVFQFVFKPRHDPLKKNYPHTEVRAYEVIDRQEVHINGKTRLMDPDVHLRWRERLLQKIKEFIQPHEECEVRQVAP